MELMEGIFVCGCLFCAIGFLVILFHILGLGILAFRDYRTGRLSKRYPSLRRVM